MTARLLAGSFDEFEAVAPWVAHEEALLAGESVAGDHFYAGGFEALAQGCEAGDAKGGMAARVAVDHRRVFLGGQMQLLEAALVPGAGVAAVGVGGTLERNQAEQFLVEGARSGERVVAGVDQKIYVIESGYQAHRNSHRINGESGRRSFTGRMRPAECSGSSRDADTDA